VFLLFVDYLFGFCVRRVIFVALVRYLCAGVASSVAGLSGSASLQGKRLTVTVTNTDLLQPREVVISTGQAKIRSATGMVLSAPDVHAHNTLLAPETVVPSQVAVKTMGTTIMHQFPPSSVTTLAIDLS
jgi:alpha-N-arabinofuranosidase